MIRRLIFLLAFSSLALLGIYGASSANAQTVVLTDTEINLIKENCHSVKNTLNQLHASDALLRVNRGQVYEALLVRMIEPFNSRLGNNRLDNRATSTIAANYKSALDTFRTDYRLYEQKLSDAMRIDCVAEPATFHRLLQEARENRKQVNTSVQKLHRVVNDYRSAVEDFLINYKDRV